MTDHPFPDPKSSPEPDRRTDSDTRDLNREVDREVDRDFDAAIYSFDDIQADLNYRQAHQALRDLVAKIDLSDRERSGLEAEITGLEDTLDKLDTATVQLAVFGMVGRGKSSLLNALVGQPLFETGPLHGVTQVTQRVEWRPQIGEDATVRVSLPGLGQSRIELVDTPGLDEIDGRDRAELAQRIARRSDLILFVISGDLTQLEFDALADIREAGKPIILVFNKVDRYPEADRQAIYAQVRDQRVRDLLAPDQIVMTAASPLVARGVKRDDGSVSVELQPGTPRVDDLKLKILDILHHEGKSLVALNSLLFADAANDRLIQRKMQLRDREAERIIWQATIAKALAIALNPVTALDLLGAAAFDILMLVSLSKLYGIPMTDTGAINLLKTIAIGMGGIGASELLAMLGLSGLKGLFGAAVPMTGGLALGGYISVAIAQAGAAGVATYAIGRVAKRYFENGASWGEDGPKAVVGRILESLDEDSILARIKDELRSKLGQTET
jgi:GTP-binding protein Era